MARTTVPCRPLVFLLLNLTHDRTLKTDLGAEGSLHLLICFSSHGHSESTSLLHLLLRLCPYVAQGDRQLSPAGQGWQG